MTIRELMEEQRTMVRSSDPAERLAAGLVLAGVLTRRLRELGDFQLGQVLDREVCSNLSVLAPELTVWIGEKVSHRHRCDFAGHDWQCSSRECVCICRVPMHTGDHSKCPVELRACPKHQPEEHTKMPAVEQKTPSKGRRIKLPPEHKLRRALRRLSRPGFAGVCVWCGYRYRRFNLEIQQAHLKDCAEYQRAKRCSPEDR